jgi:alpha-methylacyl-CoA racemase
MLLADLGAEVISIERPGGPADGRVPPASDPIRRGRSSVVLDLKHPDGVAALLDIVAGSSVLIEGNRPGVTERLGVGPADCLARNPGLVYARMTGWGQEGPLAAAAGHDLTYLAITGALHAMGRKGERPAVPLNVVGDYAGGSLYLLLGILAAVREAERSGKGQVVDAAIIDGVTSLTTVFHAMLASDLWRDERGVNVLDGGRPWYDVYETSDGKYMAVGAIEPQFYHLFMTLLELDPDVTRQAEPESWPALRDEISARFMSETRDHWSAVFEGTDACVAPVLSLTEAAHHPHMAARSAFVEVGGQHVPAPAPRFSRTPALTPAPPHPVGADTRAVLEQFGVADIDRLLETGAAVQA